MTALVAVVVESGAAGTTSSLEALRDRFGNQKLWLNRASRKRPSLAVALNCGIRSSSLLRDIQVAFDERLVDDHLDGDVAEFRLPPCLDLLAHRLEILLHTVHANRDRVHKRKALGMLREQRLKHAWDNVAKPAGTHAPSQAPNVRHQQCNVAIAGAATGEPFDNGDAAQSVRLGQAVAERRSVRCHDRTAALALTAGRRETKLG